MQKRRKSSHLAYVVARSRESGKMRKIWFPSIPEAAGAIKILDQIGIWDDECSAGTWECAESPMMIISYAERILASEKAAVAAKKAEDAKKRPKWKRDGYPRSA